MKKLIFITIIAFFFFSCGEKGGDLKNTTKKQLNISILLDLSDRINPAINPNATQYDIEDIKTITEYFRSNMLELDAYNAKGKIRLFLIPPPENIDINSVLNNLNIDCSILDNKGRKVIFDNIAQLYSNNLQKIYDETIATSGWIGSDIWRFFKDDVKDYCIDKNPDYRNILIIITDGYLYHPQSIFQEGNRVTSLERTINKYRKQNYKELIDKDDFGILTERQDLQDLEILVLEFKEKYGYKIDEDILHYVWEKWFREMGVIKFNIYRSDLPANTKTRIENFLTK